MNVPSISIVTVSFNSDLAVFKKTLKAIASQKYPKSKIEHIIMDAGSTNGSIELARKYSAKIYVYPNLLSKPLMRMSLGIKKAKNDLILFLEPDNIMTSPQWLGQMVKPFIADNKMIAAFSMYNSYENGMPLFTEYCALFGINDPIVYYLNKSEKLPHFLTHYSKGKLITDTDEYAIVEFDKNNLPTLGDNGHMVRRKIINMVNKDPELFLHTDAFSLLMEKGYQRYAVVKNSIIHYTGSSLWAYYKRRLEYKARYYDKRKFERQYLVYDSHSSIDRKNLFLFVFYALTIVQPISLSIRGYMKKHEIAWFLHPIACLLSVVTYGYSEVRGSLASIFSAL